jgi:N-methylhydantoinase A/oxoprolinase/acetone carboxylase beta subunit
VMVVKGDGSLASADAVARRPIETILSGPAASLIGAKFLSGLSDFIIADIGGTTTDIAVVEGGWPRLDREGAQVGGRRTMVQAIDMRTFGLGGDSEVDIDFSGRVLLKPGRVVPLALLGHRFPKVIETLRAMLADGESQTGAGRFVLRPLGSGQGAIPEGLAERDRALLDRLGVEPQPMTAAVRGPAEHRALDRLSRLGLVQLGCFTPSDAAHVLGLQGQWSGEAAMFGALLLKRWRQMLSPQTREAAEQDARALAQAVFDAVVARSATLLIESLAGGPIAGAEPLIAAATDGSGRFGGLAVTLTPVHPIIGVGGPAPVFYPEVGRRLNATMLLPEHGAVANAVGAAVGVVKVRCVVEITSSTAGVWRLHHRGEPLSFDDPGRALAQARGLARSEAAARAAGDGAGEPEIEIHVDRVDLPGVPGDAGLVAATVIAECWAKPRA